VEGLTMYDIIRKVHLYASMAILAFLVMYFVTGYPIIHHGLLSNPDPRKTTRTEPLRYPGELEPEEYSIYLQEIFDLRGKRQPPSQLKDGSWRFRYFRPGTAYEALVSASGDSVAITETNTSLRQTLVGFHRMHGYGGGWLYDLWSLCYDLASLSSIVFAATGVYMWYKLTRRRLLGWLLLGGSFAYAGATILYLLYAP